MDYYERVKCRCDNDYYPEPKMMPQLPSESDRNGDDPS
jgi:hypothetical protein